MPQRVQSQAGVGCCIRRAAIPEAACVAVPGFCPLESSGRQLFADLLGVGIALSDPDYNPKAVTHVTHSSDLCRAQLRPSQGAILLTEVSLCPRTILTSRQKLREQTPRAVLEQRASILLLRTPEPQTGAEPPMSAVRSTLATTPLGRMQRERARCGVRHIRRTRPRKNPAAEEDSEVPGRPKSRDRAA